MIRSLENLSDASNSNPTEKPDNLELSDSSKRISWPFDLTDNFGCNRFIKQCLHIVCDGLHSCCVLVMQHLANEVFNPEETSCGLLDPVAYRLYHCVTARNRFHLKLYVFLKNIVLHNIMSQPNWIVVRTQFYSFL